MRWCDIDWDKNIFTVQSPKTEHIEGRARREVPMFPELVPYFTAWHTQRQKGTSLVFPNLVKRSNLRTQAHRIIRKARIDPWTRVFQNLRASRETELVEDFPIHVVTQWLGNSPDTAAKHYLTMRDIHLERAVGDDSQSRGTDVGQTLAVRGVTS
jgi:integrase